MKWEILRRALKLPREQQEAFIVQACGEDTCLLEVTLERLNRLRALKAEDLSPFTRAERLIVILYHYEHMTFKEIGLTFDLPEQEIDRMHESILRRMAS